MDTTSASLLQRLRQPADKEAWNKFAELYHPLLTRWAGHWARRWGLPAADAADLVSEAFLVLLRKL